MSHVGVIDIGKTNAKFAVVDTETLREIAVRTRPNTVIESPPYPHFDIEGIWDFLKSAIAEFNARYRLSALTITTHGATAALVDEAGELTLPVLDYEHDGPDGDRGDYDVIAPPFAETLSPRLPAGLNLGAQLFHLQRHWPQAVARTSAILTYPQYWAHRLTGAAASELTSLGCHTGLWDFERGDFSSLVDAMGIRDKFPPLRSAFDVLGTVRPVLAKELGLGDEVPIHCGIHDSNASLLPHVLTTQPPFAVVSTGTWVVVCAPGGALDGLDETRDCLANIDALGRTVPSARFMGGREFSLLTGGEICEPEDAVTERVLRDRIVLLPSVQTGSGPFPQSIARWSLPSDDLDAATRHCVVSFYLALMTAECLALAGARGPVIVEGPFGRNRSYLDMLGAATGRPVIANAGNATGTSIGAALLTLGPQARPNLDYTALPPAANAGQMALYAKAWRQAVDHPFAPI
ncbi:MAG: carbohydrate kinase [Rhizobiales bacterium]|nr:carbohydrate kinase [Hyphomicrobiales bacterium]